MELFKKLKGWQKALVILGAVAVIGLMMSVGVEQIELND